MSFGLPFSVKQTKPKIFRCQLLTPLIVEVLALKSSKVCENIRSAGQLCRIMLFQAYILRIQIFFLLALLFFFIWKNFHSLHDSHSDESNGNFAFMKKWCRLKKFEF